MARKLRIIKEKTYYHIFSRGSRKGKLFIEENDYKFFLSEFMKYGKKYAIVVNVYCLMPNHIHFIVFINEANLSKFLQSLLTKYAIYFNKKYDNSGCVFQGRFGYKEIDNNNYFKLCADYIHLNPVKSNLVDLPELFEWSSCKYYFNLCKISKKSMFDIRYLLNFYDDKKNSVFDNYKNHLYSIINNPIELKGFERISLDTENIYNRRINKDSNISQIRRKEDIVYNKIILQDKILENIKKYLQIDDLKINLNSKFWGVKLNKIITYILHQLTDLKYNEIIKIVEIENIKTLYSNMKYVETKLNSDIYFNKNFNELYTYIIQNLGNSEIFENLEMSDPI